MSIFGQNKVLISAVLCKILQPKSSVELPFFVVERSPTGRRHPTQSAPTKPVSDSVLVREFLSDESDPVVVGSGRSTRNRGMLLMMRLCLCSLSSKSR